MNTTLLQAVHDYALAHADSRGFAVTAIPGLTTIRVEAPSGVDCAISRPLVALILQGAKRVTVGTQTYAFNAGDSLLIAADLPTGSQITEASRTRPYVTLVIDLDLALIAELTVEMRGAPASDHALIGHEPTDSEVADAALRLMRLLERPSALPVLQPQLIRELHYWLLAGRHGPAIRQLGCLDGHLQRVSNAVRLLRTEFARPLRVERLAQEARMSPSSFHEHFRKITSLSPLQFQKQLRLIEARRMMTAEGATASRAAFAVGYESVSQFTREYRRLFGRPPAQDAVATKQAAAPAAA
jgi:AraC-like DNA-binding protein